MRIDGNGRVAAPRGAPGDTKAAGGKARFSLSLGEGASDATGVRGAPTVAGLDAMLALQAVEDPLSKRRKLLRRGRSLLDVLDGLRLSLIDGVVSQADLAQLSALVREGREQADDPGLDAVLAEVDLRAAVELAKLEIRKR